METLIFGGLCFAVIVFVLYHALTNDWNLETVDSGVDLKGFRGQAE